MKITCTKEQSYIATIDDSDLKKIVEKAVRDMAGKEFDGSSCGMFFRMDERGYVKGEVALTKDL